MSLITEAACREREREGGGGGVGKASREPSILSFHLKLVCKYYCTFYTQRECAKKGERMDKKEGGVRRRKRKGKKRESVRERERKREHKCAVCLMKFFPSTTGDQTDRAVNPAGITQRVILTSFLTRFHLRCWFVWLFF